VVLLAAGVAALPPVLARLLTGPNPVSAGLSAVWALAFTLLLLCGGVVLGQIMLTAAGVDPQTSLKIDPLASAASLADLLPFVLQGLLAAGPLAALLALAAASLLAAANTLGDELIAFAAVSAPPGRRILMARLCVLAVASATAAVAGQWAADPGRILEWSLAFAAGGLLVPLSAALWSKGCPTEAVLLGGGVGLCVVGLGFLSDLGPLASIAVPGFDALHHPAAAGVIGLLLSAFGLMIVSLFQRATRTSEDSTILTALGRKEAPSASASRALRLARMRHFRRERGSPFRVGSARLENFSTKEFS
jgi:Na+(H+)/acetate symporter ActP